MIYRTDLATDNYFGSLINWGSGAGGRGWVMIVDDEGQIVDLAIWGWASAQIAAMAPTVGGFSITSQQVAAAWSGNGEAAAGSATNSMQRTGSADSNSESNWSWPATQSKGIQTAGLTTPFPNVNLPARTGVGYERGTGYSQYINANTEAAMFSVNATAYMRIPFDVDLEGGAAGQFRAAGVADALRRRVRGVHQWRRGRAPKRARARRHAARVQRRRHGAARRGDRNHRRDRSTSRRSFR